MIVSTQSYSDISPSWITTLLLQRGLWNSIKLWAMPCRTTQDGQVIVESSEKMWSTGGGNGNPLQYSCHENPMKRQKYKTLEDKPSRLECVQYPICYRRSCCCSVSKSRPTLRNPMNCSTPGFLILHHLPEFAQTHLHWVCYTIQPFYSLLPPSPPAFNLSQLSESFRVFFNKSPLHIRWLKYWSFNFSIHH